MAEIPIPDGYKPNKQRSSNNKGADSKNKKRLESSILNKGWVKSKSDKKCYTKKISLEFQKKFQQTVYPVCPALSKWIEKKENNRNLVMAQVLNGIREKCYSKPDLLMWDSIMRILTVFEDLIKLKPDFQTIVKCAHTENFLKGRLALIRNDLSALPQSLEKDFPKTSNECKELIEELKIAELAYGVQLHAYLVPHDLEDGNWVTFGAWREQQINYTNFCDRTEMLTLTLHYPAEAIKVMHTLHKKLSPLAVKILPEQALVKNQLKADFEKMFEEFSEHTAGTGRNSTPAKEERERAKTIDSINIHNFTGILGDVQQAENVQIGNHASIHKEAKADVAEKPAEAGRDTTPTIGWRLWACIKRIPRWIYVLVIFLAALLTCLYHLGWL